MTIKAITIFLILPFTSRAQQVRPDFVIDQSKPYVYLSFDHIGPRRPVQRQESQTGLWLKIVNNSRVPIKIWTFGLTTGDPGIGVLDEIVLLDPPETRPSSGRRKSASPPHGYSAEVSSMSSILPGREQLFSVPIEHVSHRWYLRVKFSLDVSLPVVGSGPYSYVDFFYDQIPVPALQH